jgi:hypothetical protein
MYRGQLWIFDRCQRKPNVDGMSYDLILGLGIPQISDMQLDIRVLPLKPKKALLIKEKTQSMGDTYIQQMAGIIFE